MASCVEISLEKINTRTDPYQLFLDSIRNELTKRRYKNFLYTFLKLIPNQIYSDSLGKIPKDREVKTLSIFFVELAKKDVDLASDVIAAFIKEDKKRVEKGEISSQTLPNHIKPIKVLLDANRIPIHWKSLNKLMPRREAKSKKDLDNLLKILFDVLSVNMINGQESLKGLGLMKDDTFVYKIKCEKKENSKNREGFDLKILRRI